MLEQDLPGVRVVSIDRFSYGNSAMEPTADSVNMISESLATGKPVHVVALEGGSAKFARFHDDLRAHGYSRMFAGRLEAWTYEPLDDTRRAAAEARRRLDL